MCFYDLKISVTFCGKRCLLPVRDCGMCNDNNNNNKTNERLYVLEYLEHLNCSPVTRFFDSSYILLQLQQNKYASPIIIHQNTNNNFNHRLPQKDNC